jgi:hypothetical protein
VLSLFRFLGPVRRFGNSGPEAGRPAAGWQSGHAAACKAVDAGSIPTPASIEIRRKAPVRAGKARATACGLISRKFSRFATWRPQLPTVATITSVKRALIEGHVRPDNFKGSIQVLTTLLPLAVLWIVVARSAEVNYWLTAAVTLVMSLFLLRAFVLMHKCGHGSLFRTACLNRAFGFLFGAIASLPKYVRSQHHHFHHSINGNGSRFVMHGRPLFHRQGGL